MSQLTLGDLSLAVEDLLERRHALYRPTNAGRLYEPLLRQKLGAIKKLPDAAPSGRVLKDQLDEADARHDGYGGAIWHLCEAYQRAPGVPDQVRAAAAKVRAALVPELRGLTASYQDEARAAKERRPALDALAEELKRIPVTGGGTLYDWARGYLDAGDQIDGLLSERADAPETSRKEAGLLRSVVLGLVARFRAALGDEVGANPALPRDLDRRVFAYLDLLDAHRAAKAAGDLPRPPEPEASP